MKNLSADPFLEIEFRNPTFPHLGIEIFWLSKLRSRAARSHFERVQRLHFHTLMLYTQGEGIHELDFEQHHCHPGVVIHVFPGQVQRWTDLNQTEARVLLFKPEFLERGLSQALWPGRLTLKNQPLRLIQAAFKSLELEYQQTNGDSDSERILRHQLAALLIQLEREAQVQKP